MILINFIYNRIFIPAMDVGIGAAAPFNAKARKAVDGRRGWAARLDDVLDGKPHGRRIALHAPSVGEFLQGRAVMDEILKRHNHLVPVVTYFSPSAEKIVASYDKAAASCMLPFDSQRNARRLLDIVDPSLFIFSRADAWPNLVAECARRGIKTVLVAGTLPENAGRLNPIVSGITSDALRKLDFVAAISEEDAERFVGLGVERSRVEATGDPRFDQTWKRAREVTAADMLFSGMPKKSPTLVAGSTWPKDEQVVIPAFAGAKSTSPGARMVIAPHEPSPERVRAIIESIEKLGLSAGSMSDVEADDALNPDAVVVDRVGVLAKLYFLGTVAFVGGSFVRRVHNTMEPACMGIPVLVGPRHLNAREAQLLIKAGGAFCVNDAGEMGSRLASLFRDENEAARTGKAARDFVESNLGAALNTAKLLEARFPDVLGLKETD